MPAPDVLPRYIYKIVDAAPPSPLPEAFPLSELDSKDGFIHLSTAQQIPSTASLFFASHPTLWLIKLRYADVAPDTRWEAPPGAGDGGDVPFFPHLYGRSFGPADAEGVERFDRDDGRDWKEVLGASGWLE